MISGRFVKFVLAGGFAALVNFGSRIGLSEFVAYVPSIVIAYLLGMTTAFILNRTFVFRNASNALGTQASWFVLVNVAAVLQTVLISLLFARIIFPAIGMLSQPETLAHAIGVIIPVFTSYLGHKHLSFRGSKTN